MIRKITFKKGIDVFSNNLSKEQKEDFDYYCSIFKMPDPFIIREGDFLTPTPESKFGEMMFTTYNVQGNFITTRLPSYVLSYLQHS